MLPSGQANAGRGGCGQQVRDSGLLLGGEVLARVGQGDPLLAIHERGLGENQDSV